MEKRTPFPSVFWIANSVEVLERFAYYGIYMGFGIYMEHLGFSMGQLGVVQAIFLLLSYTIPVVSGTFADRYGFKKVLLVSYLAYFPSILLLMFTRTFSGIALTMLSIGFAAGIFKPLISGTVRAVTDKTNKTLGFGIFYAMVNTGRVFWPRRCRKIARNFVEPRVRGSRHCHRHHVLITLFFYKEPKREPEGATLGQKLREIGDALSDKKFALFLLLLGIFFWLPFWAFFNLMALYVDTNLDTIRLYQNLQTVFGTSVAQFLSHQDDQGNWRLLGETMSHTGYIIMIFQIFVSRITEKTRAIPTFLTGLLIAAIGLAVAGFAAVSIPSLVFLGIALFALGEMISSPRIQEYITWIAPKEKAGLYMGSNFLATESGPFPESTPTSTAGSQNQAIPSTFGTCLPCTSSWGFLPSIFLRKASANSRSSNVSPLSAVIANPYCAKVCRSAPSRSGY